MQTDIALRDLEIAAYLVRDRRACLMCFECNHGHCHRSIVADRLARMTQLTVTPLTVENARDAVSAPASFTQLAYVGI